MGGYITPHYIVAPPPKQVQNMNTLKTVANQVETFGEYITERHYTNTIAKHYRLDTVTQAVIYYTKNNKVKQVSFIYS